MGRIWSGEARYERWLAVEIAATRAWETTGKIPAGTALKITQTKIDGKRIDEIEKEVNHDVVAFVSSIAEQCGDAGRWVHYGLTSYDVVDTAQGLALRDSCELLLNGLGELTRATKRRALEFKDAICMGRSHGIHAEPTTFGAKLAGYAFEFARQIGRLEQVSSEIATGKLAGPVGNYASVPATVEAAVLKELSLTAEDAPTQIVARDRHAAYLSTLAGIATSIERLATEIRHLARTEVREAEEPFTKGAQKGSSSMPHKRNPWRCERLSGLARLVRGYAHAGWENVVSWHERDMSQSSAERVALADASILADFAIAEMTEIVSKMPVYPERMKSNMEKSFGLHVSQALLLALVEAGESRDDAYRIVQRAAMKAWDEERPYREILKEDSRVTELVDLDQVFDDQRYLSGLDTVFLRLVALDVG